VFKHKLDPEAKATKGVSRPMWHVHIVTLKNCISRTASNS